MIYQVSNICFCKVSKLTYDTISTTYELQLKYFETTIVMFTVLVLIKLLVSTLGNCPLWDCQIPLGNGLVDLLSFIRVFVCLCDCNDFLDLNCWSILLNIRLTYWDCQGIGCTTRLSLSLSSDDMKSIFITFNT